MTIQTINPATGEPGHSYALMAPGELDDIAGSAGAAFAAWRERPATERARRLLRLADVLRASRDEFARLITLEMGKLIRESLAEVDKCAWLCEVYAERAETWLAAEEVGADGLRHRVEQVPLGVILGVMPWNFPFWQALRFAVPALAAGNAAVLKHAASVPRCALAIESAFREAGFPADLFRAVFADHAGVAALIAHDAVRGVSLTGSTAAGARVAELAGRHLKKAVLELGGSDPFIVLEDADLDQAVAGALAGRLVCMGQSCIAAKRFLVAASLAGDFARQLAARMAALKPGDPLDPATELGPLSSEEALRELLAQLDDSVAAGARVLSGGRRLERRGFYVEPAVVVDVTPAMRLAREEVFGPVAPILSVSGEDEAVALANASEFGLGGSVWTADPERGERLARRLEAGAVFVNSVVKSDPRLPFGGVKRSGYGRELSWQGLREFVNVRAVNVYAPGR